MLMEERTWLGSRFVSQIWQQLCHLSLTCISWLDLMSDMQSSYMRVPVQPAVQSSFRCVVMRLDSLR